MRCMGGSVRDEGWDLVLGSRRPGAAKVSVSESARSRHGCVARRPRVAPARRPDRPPRPADYPAFVATADVAGRSRIADPSLADEGEQRIAWAARHSPVLTALARDRLGDGALRGRRVAVVVHLEAKTAYLATLLAEAGAEVVAAGSNARSTQDEVAAALVGRGIEVHARHGASPEEFTADLLAVADTGPEIVVDDGAELTRRILEFRPDLAPRLQGVTEETTTGVARLRAFESEGRLTFPAIAANNARCKHMFDNPYGTGQSALTAILRLTNLSAAGKRFCVIGYGWVGQGLARRAAGYGGRVTVVEIDPVQALRAVMDGHRVAPLDEALEDAEIVITASSSASSSGATRWPSITARSACTGR